MSHRGSRIYTGAVACLRAALIAVALTGPAVAQQGVSFPAQDGQLVHANVYGNGNTRGVVLAHGGRFDKDSWEKQALVLAAAGFCALAIEYRGEEAERPLDILAAVRYLRKRGATSVSAVGASMGGDYAAQAAEAEPTAIDRIVLLAAGAYTPLIRMKGRKLFLLARDDANADGPRLPKFPARFIEVGDMLEAGVKDGKIYLYP